MADESFLAERAFANAEEMAKISEIRAQLAEELTARKDAGRDWPHIVGDIFFTRVLRGNSGDVTQSVAWYRKCLEVRKEFGLDEIYLEIKDLPLESSKIPLDKELSPHIKIQVNEESLLAPCGDFLVIQTPAEGGVKFDKWREEFGFANWLKYSITQFEMLLAALDRRSLEKGHILKYVFIQDCIGLAWPPKDFTEFDNKMKFEVFVNAGPEVMNRALFVAAPPFLNAIWRAVQPLLPERTKARVRIIDESFVRDAEVVECVGGEAISKVLAARAGIVAGDDGQLEGAMKVIAAGCSLEKGVNVQKGQRIEWNFKMGNAQDLADAGARGRLGKLMDKFIDGTDVEFQVSALWDREPDAEATADYSLELLTTPKTFDANSGESTGSVTAEKNGIVMLRWLNLKSWVRSKMVASFEIKTSEATGGY